MKKLIVILSVAVLLFGCKKEKTALVNVFNSSKDLDLKYEIIKDGKTFDEGQLPATAYDIIDMPVGEFKVKVTGNGFDETYSENITDPKEYENVYQMDLYNGNVIVVLNGSWFYEGHDDEEVVNDAIENPNKIFEVYSTGMYYPYNQIDMPDSIYDSDSLRILIPVPKDFWIENSEDSIYDYIIDYVEEYMPE